jgi:hypothetical protein
MTFKGFNLIIHDRGVGLALNGSRIKKYTENTHARTPTTQQAKNPARSIQPKTVRHSSIINSHVVLLASISWQLVL